MSEDDEPDWLVELAKNAEAVRRQIDHGGEALRRQVEQLGRAAEQFAASGQARPLTRRIVRAVGAGISELTAPDPAVGNAAAATETIVVPRTITGSVSFGLPRISVSGEGTIQQPDLIERNIGRILALVFLALMTSGLLGVQGPDRAAVDHYLTVIGVALPIAVVIWAGRR